MRFSLPSAPEDFAPAIGAAIAVALAKERGISDLVMMPYSDRLGRFSAWFVQLWAESLGKGGQGTTPIGAVGPLDQHSQLQLFMDGPREHYLTVVRVASAGKGPRIDTEMARLAGSRSRWPHHRRCRCGPGRSRAGGVGTCRASGAYIRSCKT